MADEDNKHRAVPDGEAHPKRFAGPESYCGVDGSSAAEKRAWHELVGLTSEEAERRIKQEKPGAKVQVIPQDFMVTMDYRLDRVRIFTDSQGKVSRAPMIG